MLEISRMNPNKVIKTQPCTSIVSLGLANILGEVLWHSVTADSSIETISHVHKNRIKEFADAFLSPITTRPVRFLEVASYAHFSGYLLAAEYGWDVTLSDISAQTLRLGKEIAESLGLKTTDSRRVTADFHELPFESESFDVVYIASALHHTLNWQLVLAELQRVTANGGILILQNEPCKRNFCFNMFSTNRRESFRPVETELFNSGIIRTVAEAYFGSRPESLFGMIENQNMPVKEIIQCLNHSGELRLLHLEEAECISEFETSLLLEPRSVVSLSKKIESELTNRIERARHALTDVDASIGFALPSEMAIQNMSSRTAARICCLPDISDSQYQVEVADIFGAALTAVMQKTKTVDGSFTSRNRNVRREKGSVEIGYPDRIALLLDQSDDLLPDIQSGSISQLEASFPSNSWSYRNESLIKSLVLKNRVGKIELQKKSLKSGRVLVMLRFYVHTQDLGCRISLLINENPVATHDAYQAESFLITGEAVVDGNVNIEVTCDYFGVNNTIIPPVTVCAVRAVWLPHVV